MEELKELEDDLLSGNPLVDSMDLQTLQSASLPHTIGGVRQAKAWRVAQLSRVANLQETLDHIARSRRKKVVQFESHVHSMTEGPTSDETKLDVENLRDMAGSAPAAKSAGVADQIAAGQKERLEIQNFFARPVQIATFSWSSGNVEQRLRVWDLYTLNNPVRAKLRNYAYLKGNLHVRIAIAGTPFHYGRVMVSYQPYDLINQTLVSYNAAEVFTTDLYQGLLCYLSQAPGAFTMDIKDNQPVELVCPFISTKPAHRLFSNSSSALAAGSSYPDLYDAGCLYVQGMTGIGSVAAVLEPVSFYVYAWMTDVELGAPTATIVGITTESRNFTKRTKRKTDEREKGPVEAFASGAVKLSDALTTIPEIAPYSMASSMVLRGIESLAAIFGWSKPVYLAPPILMKNLGFQNSTQTIGYDTVLRNTLDPKQELAVNPQVCGSSTDDMALSTICAVESFVSYFPWNTSDTVMASPIYAASIGPFSFHYVASHAAVLYNQPSALAFAAAPFAFWRGDITIRLEVICSAFHRGKLAVFYEPNISQSTLINAGISPNKQFLKVIDIQETQSVSFTVKWNALRQWLRIPNEYNEYTPQGNGLSSSVGCYNGYIGVVPMNKLTSPDGSSVNILVFVKSDNMHFNYLNASNLPNRRLIVTSSRLLNPLSVEETNLNETTANENTLSADHFGEEPVSFRALLKRYAHLDGPSFSSSTPATQFMQINRPSYPDIRVAYSTSASTNTMRNLYDYLRYAYLGIKGGMRFRFQFKTTLTQDTNLWIIVTLANVGSYAAVSTSSSTTDLTALVNGTNVFTVSSNAGVEYEIPFYSNNLFAFSFHNTLDGSGILATDDFEPQWVRNHTIGWNTDQTSKSFNTSCDIASGEDFDLMRFQGAPYWA